MPELKNGMFVRIVDEEDDFDDYGVVVNNHIVYRNDGWSDIGDELSYITAVWGDDVNGFDECNCSVYKPIWEK